jgi:surface polysaccharide O-acyltransferase-like enzyme
MTPYNSFNPGFIAAASRFPIILSISMLLCYAPILYSIKNALGRIGASALLIFIFHRPLLEMLDMAFARSLTDYGLVALLIAATITASIFICLLKERNPILQRRLKLVGF